MHPGFDIGFGAMFFMLFHGAFSFYLTGSFENQPACYNFFLKLKDASIKVLYQSYQSKQKQANHEKNYEKTSSKQMPKFMLPF